MNGTIDVLSTDPPWRFCTQLLLDTGQNPSAHPPHRISLDRFLVLSASRFSFRSIDACETISVNADANSVNVACLISTTDITLRHYSQRLSIICSWSRAKLGPYSFLNLFLQESTRLSRRMAMRLLYRSSYQPSAVVARDYRFLKI